MTLLTLNHLIELGFKPFSENIDMHSTKDFCLFYKRIYINSLNYGKAFKLNINGSLTKRIKYLEELLILL